MLAPDDTPDDIDILRAALAAEQAARRKAEARASGAEALVLVLELKLLIAKLKHDKFGASSERGCKLIDQLELQLDELVTAATEAAIAAGSPRPRMPRAIARQRRRASQCGRRCRRICRASGWWFRHPAPACAAAAGSPSWARSRHRRLPRRQARRW
jgi:hypothetical protein